MVIKCPLTIDPEEEAPEAGLGDPVQGPLDAPDHEEPHGEPHGVVQGPLAAPEHGVPHGVVLTTWYTCHVLPSLTRNTWSKWGTKPFTLALEECLITPYTKMQKDAKGMLPDTRRVKTGPSLA